MRYFLIFSILSLFLFATSCKTSEKITIAFYNTENLFDTIASPVKSDSEFTPVGPKNWNTEKYEKKISDIAKVISSIDKRQLPVLVGVCEIENDKVLNDLIADKQLKKANYQYVWEDGPDFRGIDCALLYNPSLFTLDSYKMLPVINPDDTAFVTRDVIYARGTIGGEEFHIMVNHWPSRRGGEEQSVSKRDLAAEVVRKKVDEIFKADPMANIIIMGDLNDEPSNESIAKTLQAKPNDHEPASTDLVDLMYDEMARGEGSYSYRGDWNMIDNLIVSGNLITKKSGLRTTLNNGYVFHQPFMEFVSEKGEMSPNRTYGKNYYGGISDHFPVYLILQE